MTLLIAMNCVCDHAGFLLAVGQTGERTMSLSKVETLEKGAAVRLTWLDGTSARFHAIWLRDNALDPETRSLGNGQRLITVLDIPRETTLSSASVSPNGELAVTFSPEGKSVTFPFAWLKARIYDKAIVGDSGWTSSDVDLWDSRLQARVPSGSYVKVSKDRAALGEWLASVRRYGFAVLRDVPTASGTLCKVAELFGYVRETNYGRWFEVRAEVNPNNLALRRGGAGAALGRRRKSAGHEDQAVSRIRAAFAARG
jgi:[2-(trimethylamino)ethyl]phosphonate dioxygenase